MTYIPRSDSVIAFQGNPSVLQVLATVTNPSPNQSVSGAVSVSNFPANQSVSGTIGVSIIGLSPVNVTNFPVNQNISGSVVSFVNGLQGASVSGTVNVGNFPTTQNVSGSVVASGTIGASVIGHAPVVIVGGSIAASFTPPANQSVSGTIGASIIGLTPVNVSKMDGQDIEVFNSQDDGAGNANPALLTANYGYVYNGSNWDRQRGNSSIGTLVNTGNSSVIVVGSFAPAANQSVSGTVGASVVGHAPVVIVGGSIAASFTPPANQSVSGTVGASLIGLSPVNVTNTNLNVSGSVVAFVNGTVPVNAAGSVVAFQGTSPWVTTVQASVAVAIVSGSVAVSVTPPANQSVSGTVQAELLSTNSSVIVVGSFAPAANQSVSGTVGASIIGLPPVNVTNTNLNVSGSVVAFQGTSPWQISSVYGNVSGSIAGTYANSATPSTVTGIAMMFKQNVVTSVMTEVSTTYPLPVSVMGLTPVNVTNTNINVSGSVVASGTVTVNALQGHSVSGTVQVGNFPTTQNVSGSVVAFGFPTNQNVSGSVVAFVNGTVPVNAAGSVVAFQGTNPWVIQSIVGTYGEDVAFTNADKGIMVLGVRNDTIASFVSADLDYSPHMQDSAGRTVVKPFASEDSTIISYVGSVVSGSVTLIQASAIGKRNYITDFFVANTGSVAQLITFQGGDTSIVGFTVAPAGGGSNAPGIAIPLKSNASQDLAFKTTGTSSIVYMTVKGYQAP